MRSFSVFCLFALLTTAAFGATIPDQILKTVVFIYTSPDAAPTHADGTGFFVSVPTSLGPNRNWVYLVTAKHVLHMNSNDSQSPMYPMLYVRLNRKIGDSKVFPLLIVTSGPNQTVYFNSDPSVDIAIVPIGLTDPDSYDFTVIPEDLLVTQDDFHKYHIGIGTDTFFAGMFVPYQGESKNSPIVRFGRLAMIPDKKIKFGDLYIDAYLVETFSFGGNSGSPVFFYPSADNSPGMISLGPPVIKVAGVMEGFFNDIEPLMDLHVPSSADRTIPVSKGNSGIAVVLPAQHIREILDSPPLEERRNSR